MRTAGILFLALTLGACMTQGRHEKPGLPDPVAFATAVRAGHIEARQYDFAAHGLWTLTAEQRADWRVAEEAALLPEGARESCAAEDLRGLDADIWVWMALTSDDEAAWRADVALLHAFDDRARAQLALQLSGANDPHDTITAYSAARLQTRDPRAQELFARAIADQSAIFAIPDARREGLTSKVAAMRTGLAAPRIARTACSNADWLKGQITAHGWFDARTYGEQADSGAWLIVEHASRDLAFQRQVLTLLQSLPTGATSAHNLAYLADRIAVADQHPQRYGTQLTCENRRQTPRFGLEDAAHVDARRAAARLSPLAQYLAETNRTNPCP